MLRLLCFHDPYEPHEPAWETGSPLNGQIRQIGQIGRTDGLERSERRGDAGGGAIATPTHQVDEAPSPTKPLDQKMVLRM